MLVHCKFLLPANIEYLTQQLCFIKVTVGDRSIIETQFFVINIDSNKKNVILVKLLLASLNPRSKSVLCWPPLSQ